jgi:hypothetical protein
MTTISKEYIICVPSYKRAKFCNEKTLATLHKHKIESNKIYVYVANKEDYDIYKQTLDESESKLGYKLYNKLIIGKKGLVPQRQFIMEQWPTNKHIVFLDDDVESIDLTMSLKFKKHNLDYFIKEAFNECVKNNSYIWGVYAVFNPFFRKTKTETSTDLKYIVGAFYGIINRPNLKSIQLKITKENGQKEDVERTIKYFINDGIVIRFNKIGFITKYYGKEGGLGRFEERLKPMKEACKQLEEKYSEYGHTKVRENGMAEFVLKKIPSKIISGENTKKYNKTNRIKKQNNKTRKNKQKK